jgi:hypothetical protein
MKRLIAGDIFTLVYDSAALWGLDAHDTLQRRSFSNSVAAHENDGFPLMHFERDVVKDMAAAVEGVDFLHS